MRVVTLNVILAVWLVASSFFMWQSTLSLSICFVAGLLAGGIAAWSGERAGAHWANAFLGLALVVAGILLPDVGPAAHLNNIAVGTLLVALSLVSPEHARDRERRLHAVR